MDKMTYTLNSPLTEEQWDAITDVDFDHTESITFHTKHGKKVEFIKPKKGLWIRTDKRVDLDHEFQCSVCGLSQWRENIFTFKYCPHCGAEMIGETV